MIQPFPLRYSPQRNLYPHRYLCTNAHNSFILNNTKLETQKRHPHMSGLAMVCLHNRVLLFCYSTLWYCNKLSEKANLSERFIWAHSFSVYLALLLWACGNTMDGGIQVLFTYGSQKAIETGRGCGFDIAFGTHIPVTKLPLPRSHLPEDCTFLHAWQALVMSLTHQPLGRLQIQYSSSTKQ